MMPPRSCQREHNIVLTEIIPQTAGLRLHITPSPLPLFLPPPPPFLPLLPPPPPPRFFLIILLQIIDLISRYCLHPSHHFSVAGVIFFGLSIILSSSCSSFGGVGGTVASESALRSAGTLLSRVRAPPTAPWPDGGPESLRSPCCGLAIYKNPTLLLFWTQCYSLLLLLLPELNLVSRPRHCLPPSLLPSDDFSVPRLLSLESRQAIDHALVSSVHTTPRGHFLVGPVMCLDKTGKL
ncbi:hypothetical protein PoB_007307500 [Plakobranchus ocellatus]|uniref:Uncharacterized protein n=1 Tax=Plakobranchus ocellatus TaxID=259542 RepID=A0AAV4DR02_9GAST|nr:hypothetical protein PoB_007307500 [Plakobranchus ocellatus]